AQVLFLPLQLGIKAAAQPPHPPELVLGQLPAPVGTEGRPGQLPLARAVAVAEALRLLAGLVLVAAGRLVVGPPRLLQLVPRGGALLLGLRGALTGLGGVGGGLGRARGHLGGVPRGLGLRRPLRPLDVAPAPVPLPPRHQHDTGQQRQRGAEDHQPSDEKFGPGGHGRIPPPGGAGSSFVRYPGAAGWRGGRRRAGKILAGVPPARQTRARPPASYAQAMPPSTVTRDAFARAGAVLRAARPRREIAVSELSPPRRLAPYAYALGAAVQAPDAGPAGGRSTAGRGPAGAGGPEGDAEIATGRLVLLYDPAGQPGWRG